MEFSWTAHLDMLDCLDTFGWERIRVSVHQEGWVLVYSLLSAYGIQLNPTCRESIILSLENDGGFLYPLIDK